jgi:putative transposase
VLEYYDQPPSIPLAYESSSGRRLAVMHTPDYFVIQQGAAGWLECKPEDELEKLASKNPKRYFRDGEIWHCPPGEAYAEKFGFYYRLRSSVEIDWTLQRNIQFLDDYWRFDVPAVAPTTYKAVQAEVAAMPGLLLSELFRRNEGAVNRDDVYRLIATGSLFVDLRATGLMEPEKVRVFPSQDFAEAYGRIRSSHRQEKRLPIIDLVPGTPIIWDGRISKIVNVGEKMVSLLGEDHRFAEIPLETFEGLARNGDIVARQPETTVELPSSGLLSANEGALQVANSRFDIVRRHLNKESQPGGQSISERTIRRWVAKYKRAKEYGSGYLGLLPKTSQRGNRSSKLSEESRTLMNKVIEENYETLKQKTKFAVWATLLRTCKENGVAAPSFATFCLAVRRRPVFESVLKRKGHRAAYAHTSFYWQLSPTTPRHGDRPFEIGHIDHTELDVELVCSRTGRNLGRPWMTLLMDAFSRRCLAFELSFDAPSYRSCMMILRACVRRHARLPQILAGC